MKTEVRRIGNSYGIVLPKEALQAMMVEEGSALYLTEPPRKLAANHSGEARI